MSEPTYIVECPDPNLVNVTRYGPFETIPDAQDWVNVEHFGTYMRGVAYCANGRELGQHRIPCVRQPDRGKRE